MLRKFVTTLVFAMVVLFVASTLAVAGEMTCSKADEKGCTMAKDAMGKEMAVMAPGMKSGDKMDCMDKGGKMECHKGMMEKGMKKW